MHFISILKGASALISLVETCFKNSGKDAIGLEEKKTNKTVYTAEIRDTIVGSFYMHLYRHTTFYILATTWKYKPFWHI